AAGVETDEPFWRLAARLPKDVCGSQRGMAAQIDLHLRREPAQAIAAFDPENEASFGEVHLGTDPLHPACVRLRGQQAHGGWVAVERTISEGIDVEQRHTHDGPPERDSCCDARPAPQSSMTTGYCAGRYLSSNGAGE